MLELLLEGSSAAFFCDDNSSGSRSELRGPGFGFTLPWIGFKQLRLVDKILHDSDTALRGSMMLQFTVEGLRACPVTICRRCRYTACPQDGGNANWLRADRSQRLRQSLSVILHSMAA